MGRGGGRLGDRGGRAGGVVTAEEGVLDGGVLQEDCDVRWSWSTVVIRRLAFVLEVDALGAGLPEPLSTEAKEPREDMARSSRSTTGGSKVAGVDLCGG